MKDVEINVDPDKRGKYRWNVAINGNIICQSTDPKDTEQEAIKEAKWIICTSWAVSKTTTRSEP
jgi:hypothetical protein